MPPTPEELVERIAEEVGAHPAVSRLDDGSFGTVASYLPGRRVVGVRTGGVGDPVEIGVVLRLERPFPDVVAELRRAVASVAGDVPVDVLVADVDVGEACPIEHVRQE